jgi:hypothetical protein
MRRLLTPALVTTTAILATLLPAAAASAAGGRTHGDPAPFKKGCRTYTYDYRVWTPYDDWTLEVTIRNPAGKAVHHGGFLGKPGKQGHPRRQQNVRWTMCSRTSRPGRYTIRAKLTWYVPQDGLPLLPPPPPKERVKRLPVERFRIHQR